MENAEQKSEGQLCKELLDSVNKQLDVHMKLKETLETVVAASSKSKGTSLTEEIAKQITDLIVETESLQAEEKAVFHQLFGIDADTE